jgi:hypothetical protein
LSWAVLGVGALIAAYAVQQWRVYAPADCAHYDPQLNGLGAFLRSVRASVRSAVRAPPQSR